MINRDLTPDEVESLLSATPDEQTRPPLEAQPTVAICPPQELAAVADEPARQPDTALAQRVTTALSTVGQRWCQSLKTPLRTEVSVGALDSRCLSHREFTRSSRRPPALK